MVKQSSSDGTRSPLWVASSRSASVYWSHSPTVNFCSSMAIQVLASWYWSQISQPSRLKTPKSLYFPSVYAHCRRLCSILKRLWPSSSSVLWRATSRSCSVLCSRSLSASRSDSALTLIGRLANGRERVGDGRERGGDGENWWTHCGLPLADLRKGVFRPVAWRVHDHCFLHGSRRGVVVEVGLIEGC